MAVDFAESLRVDGEEHRRGVNGLVVERGEELGGEQAGVSARAESIGRGVTRSVGRHESGLEAHSGRTSIV